MTAFLTPAGSVDVGAPPYPDSDAHLADMLELAQVALQRANSAPASAECAALDAQLAERRRWIAARVAMTDSSGELLIERVTGALRLEATELEIVMVALASELEPARLAALTGFASGTPPALSLAVLHAALAPDRPRTAWIRACLDGVIASGVIALVEPPQLPLAMAPLRLSRCVLGALLGTPVREPTLDGIVARPRYAEWVGDTPSPRLRAAISSPTARGFVLWLGGSDALALAAAVGRAAKRQLVEIDVAALARDTRWNRVAVHTALQLDQRLGGWVGLCDLRGNPSNVEAELRALQEMAAGPLIAVTEGEVPGLASIATGALRHEIARPTAAERHQIWHRTARAAGWTLPAAQLREIAEGFPLTASDIREVATAGLRLAGGNAPTVDVLRLACRQRQTSRLGTLADLIPPAFTWADLVLPDEELERLREIVDRQRHRHTVLTEWNLTAKLPYGSGTAALFAGPPGTGKTMAASILAGAVDRELYRVDLSRIVDKYIGETEKNLGRIFDAAADADAILLFDEADSLFGKRTTVSSSNDRYANLETNYLLQRIEQHPGISILTTNHVQNIDEAFARRIPFRVDFPFPEPAARAEIWRRCFPPELPRGAIDFLWLGSVFELSGGHIKSAVVRAAFMAAAERRPVELEHLTRAGQRELESMGKLASTVLPRPRAR